MSSIPISSLPLAIALDGSELVPIVQGGTTKRTTTGAIANLAGGGASLGNTQIVTTAGTHTVAHNDTVVLINKSAPSPTTLVVGPISARGSMSLTVADITGLGGDITLIPDGTDTFMGNATAVITSGGSAGTGGSETYYPNSTLAVWYT